MSLDAEAPDISLTLPELPSGWWWAKVSDVGEVKLGRQRSPKHHNGPHMRPYLRVANVFEDRIDLSDVLEMNFKPNEYDVYQLRYGDILLNEGQSLELIGRPAMYRDELPGCCFQNTLVRFRASEAVLPEFALLVFRYYLHAKRFQKIARWTVNIAHLGAGRFAELEFPVPPSNEQRRIVAATEGLFSDLDAGVAALKRARANLKKYRAAVLRAAVTGELTADWRAAHPNVEPATKLLDRILAERRRKWEADQEAKFAANGKTPPKNWRAKYLESTSPETAGLGRIPVGWCWVGFSQVATFQNGRAFPSAEYVPDGIKLLRPGNLYEDGSVAWSAKNTRWLPERWLTDFPEYLVAGNELVMNLTAQSLKDEFLGRTCLTSPDEQCLLNQRLARIAPLPGFDCKYALYLLKGALFRQFVNQLNTGSLIQHMFTSQLDEFALPLPPLAEQEAIVAEVEQQLSIVAATDDYIEASLKRSARLRQSILKEAFAGCLVPQDPKDEPASVLLDRIRTSSVSQNDEASPRIRKPRRRNRPS